MPGYSTSFKKRGAYLFDWDGVVELWKLVEAFLNKQPDIKIDLVDDHEIQNNEPTELFNDPYIKSLRIVSIRIEGYGKSGHASITLKDGWDDVPIDVRISGEREEGIKLRSDIENLFAARSQWYSWFRRPIYQSRRTFSPPFYLG